MFNENESEQLTGKMISINQNGFNSDSDEITNSRELDLCNELIKTSIGESDEEDVVPWTLQTIPTEIFLHICSFIDASFLIRRMSYVCKQFHEILSNQQTWKIRQTKRWAANGVYPPVQVNVDEFPWNRACVKREEQIKLWGNNGSNLRNVELHGHSVCVDAVHLFEGARYLASGSRDRSLIIWDVEKCFSNQEGAKLQVKGDAHTGWIWAIASNTNNLFSGSWDTTVKMWDRKSDFKLVSRFSTKVACLSLSAMDNQVACGTYDAKVLLFDPREGCNQILGYQAHRKPVLALGLDENRIISCGEDNQVVSYDIRMRKVEKKFKLPNDVTNTFPTSLSFRREDPLPLFYIGDNKGNLHLIDSLDFSIVQSYKIRHSRTIKGVFHGLGSVITCSRDGNMKVFEPSSGLVELASYSTKPQCNEFSAVHSLYNNVALAGTDGVVRLWSPIEGFSF